jgi:hypothetical protein
MKIIIDIPEEMYKAIKYGANGFSNYLHIATKIGTPLPKCHGRLGDLSKIYDKLNEVQIEGTEEYKGLGEAKQIICDATTNVEADKENRE